MSPKGRTPARFTRMFRKGDLLPAQIVLDSGPLGLLTQRPGVAPADACRAWLAAHSSRGVGIVVPEIVDYELRRELLRAGKRRPPSLDSIALPPTRTSDF